MKDPIFRLCDVVRESAYSLHNHLRHGHREVIYQRGLAHRLRKAGLDVREEFETTVYDSDNTCLGTFPADMLVEGQLLLELKATSSLVNDHAAQIIGYLRASKIDHGLLINFGSPKLQIKKFVSPRLLDSEVSEETELYEIGHEVSSI